MKLSAVIFDLDGTLIDSEPAWSKAFVGVFKRIGIDPKSDNPQTHGVSVRKNWENLIINHNINDFNVDILETYTYIEFEKHLNEIELKEGALEFIGDLKDAGTSVALATSSNWNIVDKVFENLNLHDVFDSVTTGEEVANPKPAPDIFLVALEKLGVAAEDSLVIEDSNSGVEAAVEANIKVIAISDDDDEKEVLTNANVIVQNFREITPKLIDGL